MRPVVAVCKGSTIVGRNGDIVVGKNGSIIGGGNGGTVVVGIGDEIARGGRLPHERTILEDEAVVGKGGRSFALDRGRVTVTKRVRKGAGSRATVCGGRRRADEG